MRVFNRRVAALSLLAMAMAVAPAWAWGPMGAPATARKCVRIDTGYSISGDELDSYSIVKKNLVGYTPRYDARARSAKTCRAACKVRQGCAAWAFLKVQAKVSGNYCTLYSSYDSEDYQGMYTDNKYWAGIC